jgi:hypothetical protein
MPAQDRVGRYQQTQTLHGGSGEVQQRGKERPVGRFETDSLLAELALQYGE